MATAIHKIPLSQQTKRKIFEALTIARFIDPLRVYDSSAGHRIPATVNLRAVFANPKSLQLIASQFRNVVRKNKIQYVAGYEISGIPLAAAISLDAGAQSISIRKEKHDHGMLSAIAGYIPSQGARIAPVDDGLASGKSMMKSVTNLYAEGYKNVHDYLYLLVTDVAFSRKNVAWLKKNKITLHYLVGYEEYIDWAVKNKYLSPMAGWAAKDGMADQPSWETDPSKWKRFNAAKKSGKVWARSTL